MLDVKTYRARSMQEALALVRRELGPEAAVLHTREVRSGWLRRGRQIEVTASRGVNVPSRLPARPRCGEAPAAPAPPPGPGRDELSSKLSDLQSMVEQLCRREPGGRGAGAPEAMFHLFTELLDADLSDELARELIERVRREMPGAEAADPVLVKGRIARMIEADIPIAGPIQLAAGRRHVVALVGPTGVGKTTTIAKLAANYRLRQKQRVGLLTVDTYRIAAVEQLRTYADIIDLPMEVVATPKEMRQAIARLSDLDLLLVDTAGRSPRDDVQIQELRAMLTEAVPDEVYLVLSSCASSSSLLRTAESFREVGASSLVLTKLDEAGCLGNLLPLLRGARLPLSYLTTGQNVPDDIEAADGRRLARRILGMETQGWRR